MIETYFTVAVVYIFIYNEYLFNMNIYETEHEHLYETKVPHQCSPIDRDNTTRGYECYVQTAVSLRPVPFPVHRYALLQWCCVVRFNSNSILLRRRASAPLHSLSRVSTPAQNAANNLQPGSRSAHDNG